MESNYKKEATLIKRLSVTVHVGGVFSTTPCLWLLHGQWGGEGISPWVGTGWECHGGATAFSGLRVWARKETGAKLGGEGWLS